MNRRQFLSTSTGALLTPQMLRAAADRKQPVTLPEVHREAIRQRRRRIVVQYDANDSMWGYWRLHGKDNTPFDRFREALFSFEDEPGSQIDSIWWDMAGSPFSSAYPSKVRGSVDHPLLQQWLSEGVDWVKELVNESRRRKLEVFWNHRICEVECLTEGGLSKASLPLKLEHPDWVVPASWWPQGMWNLAAEGLREHKVSLLRELAANYDLDGIQIDFSRHLPCLPVGRQWEMREHVTQFMRMVRQMLLEVAAQRGRPLLLAAKVPQTLEGCHNDGFDVQAWAEQCLVDVLTLGSRSMDIDVEGIRAAVGKDVQLQPCFDDHHATDGYRYGSIEFLRGVFANHWQRGADSVATFNWAIGTPSVAKSIVGGVVPPTHQLAYQEVGELRTMADKDKCFAVERRGGYPWSDGFFNRNDTAPLPRLLAAEAPPAPLVIHVSDAPAENTHLTLRCILFQAEDGDTFDIRLNGIALAVTTRDPEWKDPQIFSPKPQPASGGKGDYKINPQQRLLRLDCATPREAWRQGANQVEIRISAQGASSPKTSPQLEKLEAHLRYP